MTAGVSPLAVSPLSSSQTLARAIAFTRLRTDLGAYPNRARYARNLASCLASGPVTTGPTIPTVFMIFSFLGGFTHPVQEGRSQNIPPDYAAPSASITALASTSTGNSA